jgi:hypothetical protein
MEFPDEKKVMGVDRYEALITKLGIGFEPLHL